MVRKNGTFFLTYLVVSIACVMPGWALQADLNYDGKTDFFDLAILANEWLETGQQEYRPTKGTATYVVAASNAPNSVKDRADYICDGTDDDVEIQAAIGGLPNEGGIVHLSQGTFCIGSAIMLKRRITLQGIEAHTTIIRLQYNSNCDMIKYTQTENGVPSFIHLQDFTLVGHKSSQTCGRGIVFEGSGGANPMDIHCERVLVEYCKEEGWYIGDPDHLAWGIVLRACLSENNGKDGFYAHLVQGYLNSCFATLNEGSGFYIYYSVDVLISQCHSRLSGKHGFHFYLTRGLTLLGSVVINCGENTADTYNGIYLQNCSYAAIIGNNCRNVDGRAKYGIYSSYSTSIAIIGNNIHGAQTSIRAFPGLGQGISIIGNSSANCTNGVDGGGSFSCNAGMLGLEEKSSEPRDPCEGSAVLWMSDGTGTGDDGDILIKIQAGGVLKTIKLVDFSEK